MGLDEVDISEINKKVAKIAKRSKKILIRTENLENLKGQPENGELSTVKKRNKNGNTVCVWVFKKTHQSDFYNSLGYGKNIIRVGMKISDFGKLSEDRSINCELYGIGEALELIKKRKECGLVIVIIAKPRVIRNAISKALREIKKQRKDNRINPKELKRRLSEKRKSRIKTNT